MREVLNIATVILLSFSSHGQIIGISFGPNHVGSPLNIASSNHFMGNNDGGQAMLEIRVPVDQNAIIVSAGYLYLENELSNGLKISQPNYELGLNYRWERSGKFIESLKVTRIYSTGLALQLIDSFGWSNKAIAYNYRIPLPVITYGVGIMNLRKTLGNSSGWTCYVP